jgi:hypothetical protein
MMVSSPRPKSPPPPETDDDRGDWFFDELMTPQPDATQVFLRRRLEALQKETAQRAKREDGDAPPDA